MVCNNGQNVDEVDDDKRFDGCDILGKQWQQLTSPKEEKGKKDGRKPQNMRLDRSHLSPLVTLLGMVLSSFPLLISQEDKE